MPKKRFLCESSHFIEIHQDSSKFIGKPSHFSFVVMISQQKFDVRRTSKSDESSIVIELKFLHTETIQVFLGVQVQFLLPDWQFTLFNFKFLNGWDIWLRQAC